jgi:hypothetical protein
MSAGVLPAVVVVGVLLSACGSSGGGTHQSPDDVFVSAVNHRAATLGVPSSDAFTTDADRVQVLGYGQDFCHRIKVGASFSAAMHGVAVSNGLPDNLADAVAMAATAGGSLCPV